MNDREHIRLMSEYGADWPLFGDEGETDPTLLGVSAELATRLRAWQEHFERHFHHEHGWRAPEHATAYTEEGLLLHRLLTAEIGRRADVELILWPALPTQQDPQR
ncbi:hypothetical protein [Actinoplanes sp. NPDC049265]|uniref:hypothetical protein n=1 Tax=Actinoplanes sp. NPDC049265 TaxID=3363902 RepID=UPI0037249F59